jgi:O-antigen ligase
MRKAAAAARGLVLTAVALALFGGFYYVYVPLVPSFQLVLVPLLLFTAVLTAVRVEWGALWFVFAFPLVNGLPYFFRIYEDIPHAPLALVLFLAFLLGWLARAAWAGARLSFPIPLRKPVAVLAGVVLVSGLVTVWRYANFPPFLAERGHELIVNVNGVRAGGAVMSGVFNALNYLSGFLFLGILGSVIKTRADVKKWLTVLSLSLGLALVFSLGQKFISPGLGTTPAWVKLGQLNATFKDPNAFGAVLSAALPLFLALVLSARKGLRLIALALIVGTLYVFPATGSRSGFLSICISVGALCVLALDARWKAGRTKVLGSLAVLAAYLVIVVSLVVVQGGSRLSQRLTGEIETAAEGNFISRFFTGKLDLWKVAGRMVGNYPVTGVGLGAYIIELPNYLQAAGKSAVATDSAENYFIQAGAELGIVGFGLVLAIFGVILWHSAKQVRRSRNDTSSEDGDSTLSIGLFAGLLAFGVNFLFHSYIGSFDVMYTFWLFVALAFSGAPRGEDDKTRAAKRRSRTVAAAALVAVFGLIHLWNSTRSLSLEQRTARFGWSQDFGLYEAERDPERYGFRWARTSAGVTVTEPGLSVVVPLRVAHPDLGRAPVRTRIFLADAAFRKKALLREIVFTAGDWVDFEFPVAQPPPDKVYLAFETDRAWQPRRSLGTSDARWLAVALGEIWSRYPSEVSGPKTSLRETIPADRWAGDQGDRLASNGLGRMSITFEKPNPILRLWLGGSKAREVGSLVVIRLDERVIAKTMLLEETLTPLVLTPPAGAGEHVLTVEFTNDFYDPATGQDRNVSLGPVDILTRE